MYFGVMAGLTSVFGLTPELVTSLLVVLRASLWPKAELSDNANRNRANVNDNARTRLDEHFEGMSFSFKAGAGATNIELDSKMASSSAQQNS